MQKSKETENLYITEKRTNDSSRSQKDRKKEVKGEGKECEKRSQKLP